MKRATALKVLSVALVVAMMAAALPAAEWLLDASRPGAAPPVREDAARDPSLPPLPFDLPPSTGDAPTDVSPDPAGLSSLFSSGSGPASPLSTGSALLDQVLGSARLMGYDVALPPLPVAEIDAASPLRAALLEWVAVTGSPVPPAELSVGLARADALPVALQRDLALLVLSASKATLLQAQALARLTPEQVAWVHSHPEVAADLARGVESDETRLLASLAALVDTSKSLEATLLLLQAVEATRGSLAEHKDAARALADLPLAPDLDPATREVLALLAQAAASPMGDAGKIRLAARLVAAASGLDVPPSAAPVPFADALRALLAATGQRPDPDALALVLARADALPEDLQAALAAPLLAQAHAVEAARPGSGVPQAQALVEVLVASADALPVLQKHGLFWREAPDALRLAQWSPSMRAGWLVEHAALFASAGARPADLVRAGGLLHGLDLADAEVPERSFVDAFAALAAEAGRPPTPQERTDADRASRTLDPAVRDAAAVLMSGAAEASRLHKLAFAGLSADEQRFLLVEARGLDALHAKETLTEAELALAMRAAALASRVDDARLLEAGLVGARASMEAKAILDGRDAFRATAAAAQPAPTLWQRFLSALPFGGARAQGPTDGAPVPCLDAASGTSILVQVEAECGNDVLLRILLPHDLLHAPASALGSEGDCDAKTCNLGQEENTELLVITGAGSTDLGPQEVERVLCDRAPGGACATTREPAYGAPLVHLDLGGADTYARPVAMTSANATARVSLHLDLSGADTYLDPTSLYDARSPFLRLVGHETGHPTQGSALFGGVAILVDASGDDTYLARTRSQGFGRYGVGMLADLAGSDTYRGDLLAQGVSGDGFNAGLGIHLDVSGADARTAKSGMGHGLGGVLLDLSGVDHYQNDDAPYGIPAARLDALPGGDLTALDARRNEAAWTDGPGALNLGVGLDQEAVLVNSGDRDGDGWSDFQEFVAGSDPGNSREGVPEGPGSRAGKLARDEDQDLYPDFVERALSTDPRDARAYPFGVPVGPTFHDPTGIAGPLTPTDGARGLGAPEGGDKVLDLRLPLQDAGEVEAPCTGPMKLNLTDPGFDLPAIVLGDGQQTPALGGQQNLLEPTLVQPPPEAQGATAGERCVFLSYEPGSPGQGNMSQPYAGRADESRSFRFRLPAGILAVGDVVPTRYDADYFFVVDLGGDDRFLNGAGGALPVETRANPSPAAGGVGGTLNNTGSGPSGTYDHAYLAPSLVLNVDPAGWGDVLANPAAAPGRDQYAAPGDRRDFAHGSLWGVLVDTAGDDVYDAGSGSQGSMGGVLLDLAGADHYRAENLSQGASLASSPRKESSGLPMGGANPSRDASLRRAVPALLLDFGGEADNFTAAGHSQGFARGHTDDLSPCTEERCRGASPEAFGVLFAQGGADVHDTRLRRGQATQGAGTQLGVGILFGGDGANKYHAGTAVSHGATLTQSQPRATPAPNAQFPGGGILVDVGGADAYQVAGVTRPGRNDNLTLTRAPMVYNQGLVTAHADPGVHLDTEADNASAVLDALAGNGATGRTAADPEGRLGFLVHLPTARLAIGDEGPTTYSGVDYALVVDLGGSNVYLHSAGGLVPAAVASMRPATSLFAQEHAAVNLYPVSLLLDAGRDASTYRAQGPFSQGAGFFGVGVLVDNGGADAFEALPDPLHALNQTWMGSPPTVDGVVGEAEWAKALRLDLPFTSLNDSRLYVAFTLRIANDADNLYVALQGTTASETPDDRRADRLVLALDRGARHLTSAPVPGDASGAVQTGLDEVVMGPGLDGCEVQDRHWNGTFSRLDALSPRPDLKASCLVRDSGEFSYEIVKPLREAFPRDLGDLNLPYDPAVGWSEVDRLGLHLEFLEKATGTIYAWPPGTTLRDGEAGHRGNANLSDEMAAWAVTSLANLGNATPLPLATRSPSFSQGAGLAGVGVLATLGAAQSDATLVASDRAQGYGAFGGLGVLVDAGGSDAYRAGPWAHGASEAQGFGLLVEAEGNDRYVTDGQGLGYAGADASSGALFLDLYGFDAYATPRASMSLGPTSGDLATAAPSGNERVWQQGNGLGADYTLTGPLRKAVAGTLENRQFGPERVRLGIVETDADGHCTGEAVPEHLSRPILDGLVCLVAEVRLDQGDPGDPLARGGDPPVKVDGVDFLLDGVMFAGGEKVFSFRNGAGPETSTWVAKLDAAALGDGVRRIGALAVFRVEHQGAGAVLFYDDIDPTDERNPAVRGVYVNNPPRLGLDLAPRFQGAADAAFSPLASPPALPYLRADYSVSRDAGEDRLELAQGWKAPPRLSNLPCDEAGGKLCNVLPLYFVRQPGNDWGTTPRGSPADRVTKTENSRGVAPFEQFSEPLRAPLEVMKKGSFRIALPDHTTTLPLPADYKTRITLVLRDAGGAPYMVDGKPVVLHDGVFSNRREPIVVETAYGLFSGLRDQTKPLAQALDDAGAQLQQNPLALLVGALVGPCRPGGSDVAVGAVSYCEQLDGDPGAGGGITRPCSPGNVLESLVRSVLCDPALGEGLEQAAEDNEVALLTTLATNAGGAIRDGARSLQPEAATNVNWTDYYFDIDGSLLEDKGDRVVIPEGASLYLQIRSETELFGDTGGALTQTYSDLVDAYMALQQQAKDASPVPLSRDVFGVPVDPLGEVGVILNTRKSDVAATEKSVSSLTVLPFSYFTYMGGGEDQARMEIRTPAEATTRVEAVIESPGGQKVLDLAPARLLQGDVPGSPTRDGRVLAEGNVTRWLAGEGERFTQHNATFHGGSVPDGLYRVRVRATDFSGRADNESATFLLDRTPPVSRVTTRAFAGAAYVENNLVPVTWEADDAGAGLSRVAVYARAGGTPGTADFRDVSKWRHLGTFPASVASAAFTLDPAHDTYHFVAVAEDRVGNVEGANGLANGFAAGFLAKAGASAPGRSTYLTVLVDQSRPTLGLPPVPVLGARVDDFQGTATPFVKAGEPVAFRACAGDERAGGVAEVRFVLDQVNRTTDQVLSRNFTALRSGTCDDGRAMYEYAGWGGLNANKTLFPDGAWAASFEAYDQAGNRIQAGVGRVVLDSVAPTVALHAPVYPVGQTALKPGDVLVLRLDATDAWGVDEAGIAFDASALNATGKLPARLARVDGRFVHETTLRVDVPVQNGPYAVQVHVPDRAGNLQAAQAHVLVDFKRFTLDPASVRVTDLTHESLVLRWNTSENTTGQARFGTAPLELRQRSALVPNLTREHAVRIEGLAPSTRYFIRAISVNAGGIANESETVEVVTPTALFLAPVSPKPGAALSGEVPLVFDAGLRGRDDPVTYTLEARPHEEAPWSFVTTMTRKGANHTLPFNSSRWLDGGAYELKLSAEAGKDRAEVLLGPFLLDNTPPSVSILSPLVATNDTTPRLVAETRDDLSGLATAPATLLLDGQPAGSVEVEKLPDGLRLSHQVASALPPGPHVFELRVQDKAGATAIETWTVHVDADAPEVTANPLRFSPGATAAKRGGTVTLNVTVKDASGVGSVTADLAGLSAERTLRLARVARTDFFTGTFPVAAEQVSGVHRVPVTAVDLAGNLRLAGVDVPLDNAPPTVSDVRPGDATHTGFRVSIPLASEPVTLRGVATAPGSPAVTAATLEPSRSPALAFAGLLPSRTYAYVLTIVDGAGNAAESLGRFATLDDVRPPAAVEDLAVTALPNGTLHLSWRAAKDDVGVSHYRVSRSEDGSVFRPVADVPGTDWFDAGLPLEKTFHYQVAALDHGDNEGLPSERLSGVAAIPPRLAAGLATPTLGTPSTLFRYEVTYASPGGKAPEHVRILLDGVPQTMTRKDASGSFVDGVTYVYETRLAPHKRDDPHTYAFEASDGRHVARFPEDGSLLRGPLVSGDAEALAEQGGLASFAQRVPFAGLAGSALALLLALAAVALVVRKRKEGPK